MGIMNFNGYSTRLVATNKALSTLQAKKALWKGQSNFERTQSKEKLIVATEEALLQVAEAIAAVAANASGSRSDSMEDSDGLRGRKASQAKAKAKAKAKAEATQGDAKK